MRKRELIQIPIKPVDKEKQQQGKYLMMAHIEEIKNGDKILTVEIYYSMNKTPSYRVFLSTTEDITLDMQKNETKWITGMLYNVINVAYDDKLVECEETEQIIEEFLQTNKADKSYRKINERQREYREIKLEQRYKKITDPIDELMSRVSDIPEDFKQWIFDKGMSDKEYMEYKPKGKVKIGWCSHCFKTMELENTKAGEWMVCPKCGSRVIQRVRRSFERDSKYVYLLQKFEDGFILRKFSAYRNLDSTDNGVLGRTWSKREHFYECERKFMNRDFRITDDYNWEMFKQREIRWCKTEHYFTNYYYDRGLIYPYNLKETLSGSRFQHIALEELGKLEPTLEFPIKKYIYNIDSFGKVEHLIKNNLCYIAKDYISGSGKNGVLDDNAITLDKFLKVEKYDIKFLQDNKANMTGLEYLQQRRKTGQKPIAEHMNYIQEMFEGKLGRFLKMCEYTKPGKVIKYLKNSKRILYSSRQKLIDLYEDYLDMAKKLKYDMSNDFVKFPYQLQLRHDQAVDEFNNKKYKSIQLRYKKDKIKYGMEYKGLTIVVPKTSSEIIREGQDLHHCVGTYVDRVDSGYTHILFIRKTDSQDKSFYTMEVREGKVIQVRGLSNCGMTKEVEQFVRKFKKEVLKEKEGKENDA